MRPGLFIIARQGYISFGWTTGGGGGREGGFGRWGVQVSGRPFISESRLKKSYVWLQHTRMPFPCDALESFPALVV